LVLIEFRKGFLAEIRFFFGLFDTLAHAEVGESETNKSAHGSTADTCASCDDGFHA
jgi:hypothetical protein